MSTPGAGSPRPWMNVSASPQPNPSQEAPVPASPVSLIKGLHLSLSGVEHAVSRVHAFVVSGVAVAAEVISLNLVHGTALEWTQAGIALAGTLGITAGPRPKVAPAPAAPASAPPSNVASAPAPAPTPGGAP